MWYAGIGSRRVPSDIVLKMEKFAMEFAALDFTLRSGGADGSDAAFERGCDRLNGKKEIYLPWKGFNNSDSELYDCYGKMHTTSAKLVYGPRWNEISDAVKKLMTRNTAQVMGLDDLDVAYSEFVVCWTPDGCETAAKRNRNTGGTGQAIALADELGIPVFNMANDHFDKQMMHYMKRRSLFS